MATTQVIDLLLQDGSDYESTVGIVGILYATVAAHAGAAYKRTPPQKQSATAQGRSAPRPQYALSASRRLPYSRTPRARAPPLRQGCGRLLLCVPDFIVVSSYALLIVVWFEAFLDAKTLAR